MPQQIRCFIYLFFSTVKETNYLIDLSVCIIHQIKCRPTTFDSYNNVNIFFPKVKKNLITSSLDKEIRFLFIDGTKTTFFKFKTKSIYNCKLTSPIHLIWVLFPFPMHKLTPSLLGFFLFFIPCNDLVRWMEAPESITKNLKAHQLNEIQNKSMLETYLHSRFLV